jgi:hypothetical protein
MTIPLAVAAWRKLRHGKPDGSCICSQTLQMPFRPCLFDSGAQFNPADHCFNIYSITASNKIRNDCSEADTKKRLLRNREQQKLST